MQAKTISASGNVKVTIEAETFENILGPQQLRIREFGTENAVGDAEFIDPADPTFYPMTFFDGVTAFTLINTEELALRADFHFNVEGATPWVLEGDASFSRDTPSPTQDALIMDVVSAKGKLIPVQDIVTFVHEAGSPYDITQHERGGLVRLQGGSEISGEIPINRLQGYGNVVQWFTDTWQTETKVGAHGMLWHPNWSLVKIPAVSPYVSMSRNVLREDAIKSPEQVVVRPVELAR